MPRITWKREITQSTGWSGGSEGIKRHGPRRWVIFSQKLPLIGDNEHLIPQPWKEEMKP
jgi:hypothetical protein